MNRRNLRVDQTCLNCGHNVEEQYCPNCGQENTEAKQPFHYLFSNFFENFTSYESQFWKTIYNLLFSPGTLTKEYSQGKRKQYVPPVKLYIFVSFLTFFILSFLGVSVNETSNDRTQDEVGSKIDSVNNSEFLLRKALETPGLTHQDSLAIQSLFAKKENLETLDDEMKMLRLEGDLTDVSFGDAQTITAYDSIMDSHSSLSRKLFRPFAKKFFEFKEKKIPLKDIAQGFVVVFMQTLPKALFVFLPIFALILWIFHNKKKWWYFDHGVFTLHYFSFLLIVVAFLVSLKLLTPLLERYAIFNFIDSLFFLVAVIYSGVYFFIAHHRFYGTSNFKSILIGFTVFTLNVLVFSFMLVFLIGISLLLINQ
ncbi:DUF3667 domain-containing protein [Galbibacter sp.]|uniref:DUF3667 domain-containing protein n=1 Tax=Galbibacter sp. TaxID=2918471 RepID=UPI003A9059C1